MSQVFRSGRQEVSSAAGGPPAPSKSGPKRFLLPVAGLLAALLAAGMLSALVVTAFDGFEYNADELYLPAFYHDLAAGTPVRHWRLPAVPGFLPEMPLMLGALWATGQDIGLSFVLYGIIYALLLAGAIVYLIWGLVRPRWSHPFIVLACLFLWAGILLTGRDGAWLLMLVLMPSYHSGAILVGTFLLACTVRLLERPWPKALPVVWVLAAVGGIAGDPFFLVQFFVPILLCACLCRHSGIFPGGLSLKRTALLVGCSVVIAVAGLAAARRIFSLGGDVVDPVKIQITDLSPLLAETYGALKPLIGGNVGACVFAASIFVSAAAILAWQCLAVCGAGSEDGPRATGGPHFRLLFCVLFFLVSGAASLLFPLLNISRRLDSVPATRYIQPVYVLPAIILPVCLSLLASGVRRALRIAALAAVSVGCIVCFAVGGGKLLPKRLIPEQPHFVQEFDELQRTTGLTEGLGSFWVAKPTSLLSKRGMHIDAFWFPWGVFPHISNLEWYLVPGQMGRLKLRRYEFVVPHEKFPAEHITARFGPPAVIYKSPSAGQALPPAGVYEGPVLRAFVYNRKSDLAFRNYLYVPLIVAMQMDPPSKVKSPPNLQGYKWEGLPSNYPGCSIIPPGESLDVVFDPPARGDVLEICADGNDEYEVQVRYVGGRSESLKLPVMLLRGLGRRFLSLSSPDGIPEVQSLTIRPVAGDGVYSVAHVFVYEDNW